MKKTKIVLLSLGMALCVGGGVGTALALTHNGDTKVDTSSHFDQAIVLDWSTDGSAVDIDDMDNLKTGDTDYRKLTVASSKTKSVAGSVDITFTLAANDEVENAVTKGITVNVYNVDELPSGDPTASDVDGKVASISIDGYQSGAQLSKTVSFDVTANAASPTKYYIIEVSIAQTVDLAQNEVIAGLLSIAQSFRVGGGN